MKFISPVPDNESERVSCLTDFDIDYSSVSHIFKDLTRLAAKVAGTEISVINLIDTYTQWTIANYGVEAEQMPREDSICQYTIATPNYFEVKELSKDERFYDKSYVKSDPQVEYYLGVPLTTQQGFNLGALCVLDKKTKNLSPEKIELLEIIAKEIVSRIVTSKEMRELKASIYHSNQTTKKVVHDISGPLSGIVGLTEIIKGNGRANDINVVLEFNQLINDAGRSLLEMTDEILEDNIPSVQLHQLETEQTTLTDLRIKLLQLYQPQAYNKNIELTVQLVTDDINQTFLRNKILPIAGNIITNAIKFTSSQGKVEVELSLFCFDDLQTLQISVADTGIGMQQEDIDRIVGGTKGSTQGTFGEQGYGFGLPVVKQLTESLGGSLNIKSVVGNGTLFLVEIPMNKNYQQVFASRQLEVA